MKVLTVTQAKESLAKALDEALAGGTIVILRHDKTVMLQPGQVPAPIPRHPPGYFDDCYTDLAECESENGLYETI